MKYIIVILFYSLSMISCGQTSGVQKNPKTMKYEPESFNEIELNSSTKNSCSPDEKDLGWIGIEINAPMKVRVGLDDENIAIPICGLYSLEMTEIAKSSEGLQINVESKELGKTFSGYMVDEDHGTEAPIPMTGEEEEEVIEEGVLLEAYFNPDIRDYVSFPLREGQYVVSVKYAGEQSNQVVIQILEE